METRELETKNNGMTWQRGAVWMARAGYGELELSVFTTLRRVAGTPVLPRVAPVLLFPQPDARREYLYAAAD